MRAACVIIQDSDGKILAISRGGDILDWSLPGGRVESGEAISDAAIRELYEETQCVISTDAKVSFVAKYLSGRNTTYFYLVEGDIIVPNTLESIPFEGYVDWKLPQELVTKYCTFGKIQLKLFKHLNIL